MNFNDLPETNASNVEPGQHTFTIKKATKETTNNGKPMIVLELSVPESENFKTYDRFVLFNQEWKKEPFGQYKLKNLLKAVQWTPKKDFTMDILCEVLPGMKFKANLEEEEGTNGKTYLNIKDPESYEPVNKSDQKDNQDVKPEDFIEKQESEKVDEKIINELEDDDDIV